MPFVKEVTEPGSTVHTDGSLGYLPVEAAGYDHDVTFLKEQKKTASELMPGSSGGVIAQALTNGHPPGSGGSGASRLLS